MTVCLYKNYLLKIFGKAKATKVYLSYCRERKSNTLGYSQESNLIMALNSTRTGVASVLLLDFHSLIRKGESIIRIQFNWPSKVFSCRKKQTPCLIISRFNKNYKPSAKDRVPKNSF